MSQTLTVFTDVPLEAAARDAICLHAPDLYISLPERAELELTGPGGARSVRARPPAMARSTGETPVEGEVCYVPSKYAAGTSTLFDTPDAARTGAHGVDPVAGRIVLTEGFSMPGPVQAFERRGAIAQIYIHPGERIHEGIGTSIWGAPTSESLWRKPTTPVVCINRPDGEALIADVQLDIDSPGCADATAYDEVMWMAEADALGLPSERQAAARG